MKRIVQATLWFVGSGLAWLGPAGSAEACWCSRVYTSYYHDPCVSCPTIARSYYVPVAACPTTSCKTTNVERCYYEPQTTVETRSYFTPEVTYVRRSYYDPFTCCTQSYLVPTTRYVERSYQVPVTSYVKRCSTEPVTSCTTSHSTVVESSYYVPQTYVSSYWSPYGKVYYPVVTVTPLVVSPSCPAPSSNGATTRESEYPPANGTKKSGDTTNGGSKPPEPKPMPEKKQGSSQQGLRAGPRAAGDTLRWSR